MGCVRLELVATWVHQNITPAQVHVVGDMVLKRNAKNKLLVHRAMPEMPQCHAGDGAPTDGHGAQELRHGVGHLRYHVFRVKPLRSGRGCRAPLDFVMTNCVYYHP